MRIFCLMMILMLTSCQTVYRSNNSHVSNKHYQQPVYQRTKAGSKTEHGQGYYFSRRKHQIPAQPSASIAVDGAPKGPMPKLIKKAQPVNEPFSRYGNPESYAVDGYKYQVMRSASGYKTRGIASWYGTKFHRKRTSSGEDYDMYAMTAAHKTLPLPTYVRVKNLANGRVAIVKVNDRGPFHHDRIIDLSYAAATTLGLLPKGTAPVEIEALTSSLPGRAPIAHYYVQAGAFSAEKFAQLLQDKLAKITPSPVFIEKYQQHFVVKVGPFADKAMTDSLKAKLATIGILGTFALLQ